MKEKVGNSPKEPGCEEDDGEYILKGDGKVSDKFFIFKKRKT